jgi:hypothetical protein
MTVMLITEHIRNVNVTVKAWTAILTAAWQVPDMALMKIMVATATTTNKIIYG